MSDNQFLRCPARMDDGRIFATYSSSQTLIDMIKRANGIDLCSYDNNDMRAYLQHNGTKLMDSERRFMLKSVCNLPKKRIVIMPPYVQ
jgi:hypothetical protein